MLAGRLTWIGDWLNIVDKVKYVDFLFPGFLTWIKLEVLFTEVGIHDKESFGGMVINVKLDMLSFKIPGKDLGSHV